MTSYNSTARVPFAKGGKVDKKPIKPKRIILWKGKAKDWPGAQKAKERTGKNQGGKIGQRIKSKGRRLDEKPKKGSSEYETWKKKKIDEIRHGKGKKLPGYRDRANTVPIVFAKGGKADKNWIQGVNKSIKARGTKGVCTGKKFGSASCKPGSKRYNLAKTFKKMARAKHASGGLVRFI